MLRLRNTAHCTGSPFYWITNIVKSEIAELQTLILPVMRKIFLVNLGKQLGKSKNGDVSPTEPGTQYFFT